MSSSHPDDIWELIK